MRARLLLPGVRLGHEKGAGGQRGIAATKDQVFIADWRLVIGDWGLTRRGGLIAD